MINQGGTAPKVYICTRTLLPQKFLPKHLSFCFKSSNAAQKNLEKGVELVVGGSVINGAYPV